MVWLHLDWVGPVAGQPGGLTIQWLCRGPTLRHSLVPVDHIFRAKYRLGRRSPEVLPHGRPIGRPAGNAEQVGHDLLGGKSVEAAECGPEPVDPFVDLVDADAEKLVAQVDRIALGLGRAFSDGCPPPRSAACGASRSFPSNSRFRISTGSDNERDDIF